MAAVILFAQSRRGGVVSILIPKASSLFLDKNELVSRIPFISLRLCRSSWLCSAVHSAEHSRLVIYHDNSGGRVLMKDGARTSF